MKKLIFLSAFLFVSFLIQGQGINTALSDSVLQITTGNSDTILITVVPFGGFNQQVIFSSQCISGTCAGITISFLPSAINYPYTNGAKLIASVNLSCIPGQYAFIIEGSNGPVSSHDTLYINVGSGNCPIQNPNYANANHFKRSMAIDQNGIKWMVYGPELYKYDSQNWTEYTQANSQLNGSTSDVCVGPDTSIWVTTDGGLCNFDGTFWTVYDTTNSGLLSNNLQSVAIDDSGKIWVAAMNDYNIPGNREGGVYTFDGVTWTKYDSLNSSLPNNNVAHVSIDKNGVAWIVTHAYDWSAASGASITKFDGVNWTLYSSSNSCIPPSSSYGKVCFDSHNNAWFKLGYHLGGSPNGGYGFLRTDGIIWEVWDDTTQTPFNHRIYSSNCNVISQDNQSQLPSPSVYNLIIDHLDRVWIATMNGSGGEGLVKLEYGNWEIFNISNSILTGNAVGAIGEFKDTVWFSVTSDYTSSGNKVFYYTCSPNTTNTNELLSDKINVYPIPTSSEINFELEDGIENNTVLKLFDITGQLIKQYHVHSGNNSVPFENESNGVYIYKIETMKKVYSGRIIIAK